MPSAAHFTALTPEIILTAAEQMGIRSTGYYNALNSLENRVFEVEFEDNNKVIIKFYRPGRWSEAAILDEHRLLLALQEEEIPVIAPLKFSDGKTLRKFDDFYFALFPKMGGRIPNDFSLSDYRDLGRIVARIHNIAARLGLKNRHELSATTYGTHALKSLMENHRIERLKKNQAIMTRYQATAERFIALAQACLSAAPHSLIHADLHRGNLLQPGRNFLVLDFDDLAYGPVAQDFWLLLPSRIENCANEFQAILEGYNDFRQMTSPVPAVCEALRGLRYIRYCAWICERYEDSAFQLAFPGWGEERYWQEQINDLYEQIQILEQ